MKCTFNKELSRYLSTYIGIPVSFVILSHEEENIVSFTRRTISQYTHTLFILLFLLCKSSFNSCISLLLLLLVLLLSVVGEWVEGRKVLVGGGWVACLLFGFGRWEKNIQSCGGRGGGERMLLFKKLQTLTHTIANKNIRRQNVIELVGLSAKTENNFFCYGKKKGN